MEKIGDNWNQDMRIVPINFNLEDKAMLGHCKMILEKTVINLLSIFNHNKKIWLLVYENVNLKGFSNRHLANFCLIILSVYSIFYSILGLQSEKIRRSQTYYTRDAPKKFS